MSDIKVSVIVPAYNCSGTIEKCIRTIMSQTIDKMEIIVVNDGSTDNTDEVLKKLAIQDSRIKIFSQTNSGASSARNKGIDEAEGEYVIFVDSDDELKTDTLEKLVQIMDINEYDYLVANYKRVITKSNGSLEEFFPEREKREFNSNEQLWSSVMNLLNEGVINAPWGKVYKKSILHDNGIRMNCRLSLGEDLQFNLDYLEFVNKALVIPDIMYVYNTQNSSLTTSYREKMFEERKESIEGLRNHLIRHGIDINIIHFLYIKLFFSCVMQEKAHGSRYATRKGIINSLIDLAPIRDAVEKYEAIGVKDKALLSVIKKKNILLIDAIAGFLLCLKKHMKTNVNRISV